MSDKSALKKIINIAVGVVISTIAVLIFVFGINSTIFGYDIVVAPIDFVSISKIIANIDIFYLVLALICSQIPFFFRAFRLEEIVGKKELFNFKNALHYSILGFGMNNVFPARAGELYKAFLIKKKSNISYFSSLAVLFVERLFDGFLMCIFFLISIYIVEPHLLEGSAIFKVLSLFKLLSLVGITGFFLSIFLVYMLRKRESVLFIPVKWEEFILKEFRMLDSFLLRRSPKKFLYLIIHSSFVWLFLGLGLYFLMCAFGLAPLGFVSAFFTEGVLGFSVALPQAPGYIGVFQIGTSTALGSLGVDVSIAQSMAIILWFIQIVPVALGFLVLFALGKRE